MPYNDDTDRFCPTCKGARGFLDPNVNGYGFGSWTPCWACVVPEEPEPVIGPDALMDAAFGSREARMKWDAERWAEYHGERA